MLAELSNILKWDSDESGLGQEICINDMNADGSFLIHYFISFNVKKKRNVCLISTTQAFNHYNNACNKLGVSLKTATENGSFHTIDCLQILTESVLENKNGDGKSLLSGIKNLYFLLKFAINQFVERCNEPVVLIFDNISTLVSLGYSEVDVINLVVYLRSLVSLKSLNSVVWVTRMFLPASGHHQDSELDRIQSHLKGHADIVLKVENLKSGFCKEVHGLVKIHSLLPSTDESSYHYRIQDKSVNFFPLGTSSAVL